MVLNEYRKKGVVAEGIAVYSLRCLAMRAEILLCFLLYCAYACVQIPDGEQGDK